MELQCEKMFLRLKKSLDSQTHFFFFKIDECWLLFAFLSSIFLDILVCLAKQNGDSYAESFGNASVISLNQH